MNTISGTVAHLGQAEQMAFLEFSGHAKVAAILQLTDDRDLPQMVGSIPLWASFSPANE